MRAVQLALLVICIQFGIGLVVESGLFTGMYFENTLTDVSLPSDMSALDIVEQDQVSINIFTMVKNTLTWGWLIQFFQPAYANDTATRTFVNTILVLLRSATGIIIGAAVLEFFRNRTSVLG